MKTLIDRLSVKYSEPTDSIAEYTYRAQSVLHDKGIEESCLNILEEIQKVNKIENSKYQDVLALYLMLRN
jgi:hypothetical protein